MDVEKLRNVCVRMERVTEEFPFDQDILVFKVMGKIFCLTSMSEPISCNLKCDPERAILLREEYYQVKPGFHMNKKHWNTILFEGSMDESLFEDLIRHSYQLVAQGMTKKLREELAQLPDKD